MTLSTFFGCVLIAYAPSTVLLLAYASRRSALLILTIIRCAKSTETGGNDRSILSPPNAAFRRRRNPITAA